MDEPVAALSKKDFEALAGFRFAIRSYLRFNEDAVRSRGLSPQQDLVARTADPDDARAVRVVLTATGERALGLLSALHRDELRRMGSALTPPPWPESDSSS